MARDHVCVLPAEEDVRWAAPPAEALLGLDGRLLHITAAGSDYDCVTRSFGPKLAVYQAPVCGSGHCRVIPYWAEATGRHRLRALQASKRTGELFCRLEGGRLFIAGEAVLFAESVLHLPQLD